MFQFHHVALSVTDLDRSASFYAELGFEEVVRWQAPDGSLQIAHLRLKESVLELFCYASAQPAPEPTRTLETDLPVIGIRHFGLKVASIQVARKRLLQQGHTDATEIKRGRTGIDYFFIRDPDGLFVEIVQDDRNL